MTTGVVVPGDDSGVVVDVDASVVDVVDVVDEVEVVVDVELVVVVPVESEHVGTLTVLASIVTAPVMAWTRPFTTAPVSSVIEVVARMDPAKLVVVPRVAELPTCQNTLHACAPFSSTTDADVAVVSVEAAWKMKTESVFPAPFRVTVPVRAMLDAEW